MIGIAAKLRKSTLHIALGSTEYYLAYVVLDPPRLSLVFQPVVQATSSTNFITYQESVGPNAIIQVYHDDLHATRLNQGPPSLVPALEMKPPPCR